MEEKGKNNGFSIDQILASIQSLDDRLKRIESKIFDENATSMESAFQPTQTEVIESHQSLERDHTESFLESNVGKYVLGWLSNIVFVFAVAYIMIYVRNIGYPVFSFILGFAGVLGMLIFSFLIKSHFKYISFTIIVSALLLLFYVTASLHFFSTTPLLSSKILTIFLLILVIGGQFYFAIQRNSRSLAGVGLIMLLLTAILSNATHLMLPLNALAAAVVVYIFIRYEWWRIIILSIILVYFVHLLWLFNNPFMGNPMQTVDSHQNNLVYLFFYGAIFSLPMIFSHWKKTSDPTFISIMLINALGFVLTVFLVIISFYTEDYAWIFGILSVLCLIYSVALKIKSNLRYSPAFYACYGFISLSVVIYGYFDLPNSYLLFALESLLVLVMAIWFRSTLIIIVNALLFFFLLIFYLSTTESVDSINIVFAIVGLATAYILNWQKEILALRTEIFRNFYLLTGLIMVLYALHHIVPSQYVTLSWTVVASIFFLLSFLLKNVKYRWMAIGTLMITGFYLLFVDLKNMDMGYRISSFLFLAVISLGASLYYARRSKKSE